MLPICHRGLAVTHGAGSQGGGVRETPVWVLEGHCQSGRAEDTREPSCDSGKGGWTGRATGDGSGYGGRGRESLEEMAAARAQARDRWRTRPAVCPGHRGNARCPPWPPRPRSAPSLLPVRCGHTLLIPTLGRLRIPEVRCQPGFQKGSSPAPQNKRAPLVKCPHGQNTTSPPSGCGPTRPEGRQRTSWPPTPHPQGPGEAGDCRAWAGGTREGCPLTHAEPRDSAEDGGSDSWAPLQLPSVGTPPQRKGAHTSALSPRRPETWHCLLPAHSPQMLREPPASAS